MPVKQKPRQGHPPDLLLLIGNSVCEYLRAVLHSESETKSVSLSVTPDEAGRWRLPRPCASSFSLSRALHRAVSVPASGWVGGIILKGMLAILFPTEKYLWTI